MAHLPLLIGLMRPPLGNSAREWRAARATLARRAYEEGYGLLDTFDLTGDRTLDEATYAAVEGLIIRQEVSALMVVGISNIARVDAMALRLGLHVLTIREPLRLPGDPQPSQIGRGCS